MSENSINAGKCDCGRTLMLAPDSWFRCECGRMYCVESKGAVLPASSGFVVVSEAVKLQ